MEKSINELLEELLLAKRLDPETYIELLRAVRSTIGPIMSKSYGKGMVVNTLDVDELGETAMRIAYEENPGIKDYQVARMLGVSVRTIYRYKAKMNYKP